MAANLKLAIGVTIDPSGARSGGASAQAAVAGIGEEADRTRTKLQQLINASVGLHDGAANNNVRSWTGALAAEGLSAENLRAKYDLRYAAVRKYREALTEIRMAHAQGALSETAMAEAISRHRQATLASIDALKGRKAVLNEQAVANDNLPFLGRNARSFETANIAAQFQDIGVTAAMGMSPLMIALQQGTQLSSVIASMERPAQGLLAAFTSLISPISLVTIGLVAGAAALIQYFTTAESGAGKTNALFNEQNDLIRRAAQLWGDAAPQLKAYVDELDRADKITQGREASEILAGRELEGLGDKLGEVSREFVAAQNALKSTGDTTFVGQFSTAFTELRSKLDDGKATIADVNAAQKMLAEGVAKYGAPEVLKFSQIFDAVTAAIYRSIEASRKAQSEWVKGIAGADNVQDIVSGSFFTENGRSFRTADFQPRNPAIPSARPNIELGGDPDPVYNIPVPTARPSDLDRDDPYADILKSADKRIAQMRQEQEAAGLLGGAAETLRFQHQLMNEALEKNLSLDEAQIAAIREKAKVYGQLSEAVARSRLADGLRFEREQLFRSEEDQKIANRLRGAGLSVDLSSQEATAIRENIRIEELRNGVRGFFADFRDGLLQGDSFGEALSNAIVNALNKGLEKLTDSLINDLVNLVTRSGSKDGGWLSKLFGLGGSAANDNTITGSIARAANDNSVFSAPLIAVSRSPIGSASGSGAELAWNFWKSKGLADHQAAAVLGNIKAESNFNPLAIGDSGKAFGLFQHNDRSSSLFNAIGGRANLGDALAQHKFAYSELMGSEGRAWNALLGAKDVRSATAAFAGFERPRGFSWANPEGAHNFTGRLAGAEEALSKFGGTAGQVNGSLGSLGSGVDAAGKGLNSLGGGLNKFGQTLASAGSGGGGLGSLFASLSSYGLSVFASSGQFASAVAGGSIGLWSDGGWTGPGGKYEPAGIVHRGEVVWSQADVARAGGVAVVDAMRLGQRGYANGGAVDVQPIGLPRAANSNEAAGGGSGRDRAPANFNISLEGARGDREIETAAYRGMQRALQEYDAGLPDRVAQINERPRWR
ncbi:phage tail tip lysozyme [Ensifer sesbaniae]|uniref:phage tail tip lysozyme n=1 Tax=Ensifer sesbaniae TaxID=1214071 RepID=UPI00200176D1|nr:phage tail tip lysozyme [Ensifer sesbaniae]